MLSLAELWFQHADADLRSAKILLREGIYNMVCFHSQQVAEKLFKAIIANYHKEIPRTHNLIRLHKIAEDLVGKEIKIHEDTLSFLNDIYIDSRYPSDFGIMPSGQATASEAETAYKSAEEINCYLRRII
jgi:HEPN domain-containing protein